MSKKAKEKRIKDKTNQKNPDFMGQV